MKRTQTADRWRVSDELWAKIQPLLPDHPNTHRFGGGRPRKPDRLCADAIFFRLRTGCQWKALDATGICPGSTAHDRFQEWVAAGVFLRLWKAGLLKYDELRGIDWSWLSMDGCMTKAPLGGEKDGQEPHRPGQARGQAELADRGPWHPDRLGGGRGQPQRLQIGPSDHRGYRHRSPHAECR
jgi:transposase